MINQNLYNLGKKIFNINRSITGKGVKKTLVIFKKELKKLKIKKISSGTNVFDWKIPPEWNVKKLMLKINLEKKL